MPDLGDLTVHMLEHLFIVGVLAPVLALLVRRRPVAGGLWLVAGVVASSLALWLWHVPALFDAADRSPALHAAEHLSFLATSVLLWWAVWRDGTGAGVIALFVSTLPATALGAALTLAGHPWYSHYPTLADQRIAGALMWAAGSVTGLAAAALAFAAWLTSSDSGGHSSRKPVVMSSRRVG